MIESHKAGKVVRDWKDKSLWLTFRERFGGER
jgi:hypothetical protein